MRGHRLIAVTLALFAPGGLLAAQPPDARSNEEVQAALRRLERLAADLSVNADELWEKLVTLRRLHPGTAAGAGASRLMTHVRSPLDRLDPKQIPGPERFDWQPKGLVAVLGEHRGRHWGPVHDVSKSPDGKLVASVAMADGLRLWDAATMREMLWLNTARSFAFSPDGKTLAVAEREEVIRLYDLDRGRLKPRSVLRKKNHRIYSLTFAPNSQVLAALCWEQPDRKARQRVAVREVFVLWEWGKDGLKERALPRIANADQRGAFSVDGKLFAHRGAYDQLYLWDLGKEPAALQTSLEKVQAFALSSKDKLLVTLGVERVPKFWDVGGAKPKVLGTVPLRRMVSSLSFSPDGRSLVGLDNGRDLQVWALAAVRRQFADKGPPATPRAAKVPFRPATMRSSPDGRQLVFGGWDGTVRLWDIAQAKDLLPPEGHCNGVNAAFSPDGQTLATIGGDRTLRLWDLGGTRPRQATLQTIKDKGKAARSLTFAPGGKHLATYQTPGRLVQLWEVRGDKLNPLSSIRLDRSSSVRQVQFSPRGGRLLLAGAKEVDSDESLEKAWLSVWQLGDGQEKPKEEASYLLGDASRIPKDPGLRAMAFSDDGRRLALVAQSSLHLWDWHSRRKELAVFKSKVCDFCWVAVAPDGAEVVTSGRDTFADRVQGVQWLGGFHFWGLKGGALRGQGAVLAGEEWGGQAEYALGGAALLMGDLEKEYVLLDRATERKLWRWRPPGFHCSGFAVAPDGRHAALCNANGTVYIVRLKETPKR